MVSDINSVDSCAALSRMSATFGAPLPQDGCRWRVNLDAADCVPCNDTHVEMAMFPVETGIAGSLVTLLDCQLRGVVDCGPRKIDKDMDSTGPSGCTCGHEAG